ncbi:MAG: hypothetical protein ABIV94_01710 [Acidimicrobiales bacterium]
MQPLHVLVGGALRGAAAGAAGTTALNAATYLDMTARARPPSSTPQDTVGALEERAGTSLPGSEEDRENRRGALGALTGIAAGVSVGALLGVAQAAGWRPRGPALAMFATVGALLAGNAPMTLLGVTDPRKWAAADWAADIVPHVAYGAVAAATLSVARPETSLRSATP